jgi:hypothetical protein
MGASPSVLYAQDAHRWANGGDISPRAASALVIGRNAGFERVVGGADEVI